MQDRHYASEEYKKEVLEHMSIHQLIDTILINPTVHVSPSYRDTGLSASYTFKPLSNLVYTRDQQVNPLLGHILHPSLNSVHSALRSLHKYILRLSVEGSVAGSPARDMPGAGTLQLHTPHAAAWLQITTCRGVVSGRLRSQQRQLEVELMRFCFRKLGAVSNAFSWHQRCFCLS